MQSKNQVKKMVLGSAQLSAGIFGLTSSLSLFIIGVILICVSMCYKKFKIRKYLRNQQINELLQVEEDL